MEITLEALGLSKEQIQERVINLTVERLLYSTGYDEECDETDEPTKFQKQLKDRVVQRIDQAIDNIAAKHVLPNIETLIEDFVLQETNSWGERKGKPVTFTEYLVQRADAYMREPVNYNGQDREQYGRNRSGWSSSSERLAYMINDKLQYEISNALKNSLKTVQESIGDSVAQSVKMRLKDITTNIQVAVK